MPKFLPSIRIAWLQTNGEVRGKRNYIRGCSGLRLAEAFRKQTIGSSRLVLLDTHTFIIGLYYNYNYCFDVQRIVYKLNM